MKCEFASFFCTPTDPGLQDNSFFAYTGVSSIPTDQSGGNTINGGVGRPLAKRLLTSVAARLFRSRYAGKGSVTTRILSPSIHQYEQVLAQSAHSSPVITSGANATVTQFQVKSSAPTRNEATVPSYPVTSVCVCIGWIA